MLSTRQNKTLFCLLCLCTSFVLTAGNTPPILNMDRNWLVQDDDPIGTVVGRVEAHDQEGDPVGYTLSHPSFGVDGSPYFEIDHHGRVRLKETLEGKGGQNYFIKITVSDGSIPISAEVRVQVKAGGDQAPNNSLHRGGLLAALNPHLPPGFGSNRPFSSNPPPFSSNRPPFSSNHPFNNPPVNFDSFFGTGGGSKNTPPILQLPDHKLWQVNHNADVGSTVDTVKGFDVEDPTAPISFALNNSKGLLSIDPKSGLVTVEKSLLHEVGDHYVVVHVSNDHGTGSGDMTLRVDGPPQYRATTIKTTDSLPPIEYEENYNYVETIEEHTQPGLIAIIKNGPTAPPLSTATDDIEGLSSNENANDNLDNKTDDDEEEAEYSETKVVVIVLPLLGLSAAIGVILWCCKRSVNKKALTKENSAVIYDKKGLELTPVSSTSNSLTQGVTPVLPTGIKRFWGRRASENSYEENENIRNIPQSLRSLSSKETISKDIIPEPADEWEFPRHKLKVIGILGEGCFGQVWKYEAQDMHILGPGKTLVAVKTLKESAGHQERSDLQQELKVLKNLGTHPNVVSLLACCTEKEPILVVLEYLINGKLQSYLRDRRSQTPYNNLHGTSTSLSPRDLTIFALQVAKGMEYLSTHGIVHRDLAARNVLVGEDKVCKVADFGFARDIANNHVYERKSDGRLPIRWMAVESLYDNIFTSKTDVWSFGILLWEIVTLGSTPYPGMSAEEVMKKIRGGYRLEKPDYCKREVYNIMYYCWYEDPKDRPSFKELIKYLEDLITSEVDYIEINKFPERCYYNVNTAAASGELL